MRITPETYYRLERESPDKHDYLDGIMYPSPTQGGTSRHSLIIVNLLGEIGKRLKGHRCCVYESSLRLCVKSTGLRTYPDVAIYCDELHLDDEDEFGETPTNPFIVFEVLAKGVEGYERGVKAVHYRRVDSLHGYVLVSQDRPHAEVNARLRGDSWEMKDVIGLEAKLALAGLEIEVPMVEVYDRIEFPTFSPPLPISSS